VEALGAALSRVGGILGMGGAASRDRLLQVVLVVLHHELSGVTGPPAADSPAHELGCQDMLRTASVQKVEMVPPACMRVQMAEFEVEFGGRL
jgi:hypothetical protein